MFARSLDLFAAHPWLVVALFAAVLLVLLLPYRVERRRVRRRETHLYMSLIYRYECGPGYAILYVDGLRRLQRALLDMLGAATALLRGALSLVRGDVLRWLVDLLRKLGDELRRWLGL